MSITDKDTHDRVIAIIAEITDIPTDELLPDKSLRDDLEIDSLTTIEVAVTIQDEFDIEVDDDKLKELNTIQDVIDLVRSARLAAAT